jgi:adenosylcobinamide-GDP ribazoletransferase
MTWPGLRLAITLLTAVPLPGGGPMPDDGALQRRTAAAALYWAPFVGAVLGAIAAAVLIAGGDLHLGSLLAAVLAIAVLAALTRGLHLDGLADLADALGSRRPAEEALQIMKRSDIGPFGVVALVLTLLTQVTALARAEQLGRGPLAIVVATVTARLAVVVACRRGIPAARSGGLGSLVAGTVQPIVAAALILAALGGAIALGWSYAVAIAAGLSAAALVTAIAVRRLGGITGDVLGAIAEITAAVCLVVIAIS